MKPGCRYLSAGTNANMPPRRQVVMAGISSAAVAMLAIPMGASSAQFVWNVTPSAPAGLYRIERGAWNAGDRVAVLLSPDLAADLDKRGVLRSGKLLIKRVTAASGDTVCRLHDELSVNGGVVARAKVRSSDGALLPVWYGCVTLNDEEVFLLGDTPSSYEGRYFGITAANDVLGRARLLVAF